MKKPPITRTGALRPEEQAPASGLWKAPVALLPSMAIGMGAATAGQQGVATVHAWNLLAMVGILVVWVMVTAVRMVRGGRPQGMFAGATWQLGAVIGALVMAAPFGFLGGRSVMQVLMEILGLP